MLSSILNYFSYKQTSDIVNSGLFKTESDYIRRKREEQIQRDKHLGKSLLVNNPTRPMALYGLRNFNLKNIL